MQLVGHGLRIGPEFLVEAEVAHKRPMEEVDDDQIDRNALLPEGTRHVQQFLLIPVTQFALPETETPFGHDRSMPGGVGILVFNLRIGADSDPIVDLVRDSRLPFGAVIAEGHGTDRRIVPQESVPFAGNHKRDGHLGVAMRQF